MTKEFQASIVHTEDTIQRLFKMEYHTYELFKLFIWMLVGASMVLSAIFVEMSMAFQAILLLIGCWLLISSDFPAALKAEQAIEARGGSLPVMEYTFREKGVTVSGEGTMELKYDQFQRLVRDEKYLYMFLSRNSVCMVDRTRITPSCEELLSFMEKKTGLKWGWPKSLLMMNVKDIRSAFRDFKGR